MDPCACVQTRESIHAPTCTKWDKPRRRHAHRRDTAIFNVPVWLMSPESPCLGCKSLDFCSSLFCLVVIWEQTRAHSCTRAHTHMLTLPHKPLQLLWWKSHRQVEWRQWLSFVQTLTCFCFVCTALLTMTTGFWQWKLGTWIHEINKTNYKHDKKGQ